MFNRLPKGLIEEIETLKIKHLFKKRQYIYKASEIPQGFYFIKKGFVGLVFACENGNDHFLRFFKGNQLLGHRSFLAEEIYHASALCLEDTEVFFIDKKNAGYLLKKYPDFSSMLLKNLAQELGKCEIHRVKFSEKEVIQRAAESIVYLFEFYPEYKWTRLEIAQYCESTPTTIVKVLSKLESMGYIKQMGHKILILNKDALLRL